MKQTFGAGTFGCGTFACGTLAGAAVSVDGSRLPIFRFREPRHYVLRGRGGRLVWTAGAALLSVERNPLVPEDEAALVMLMF